MSVFSDVRNEMATSERALKLFDPAEKLVYDPKIPADAICNDMTPRTMPINTAAKPFVHGILLETLIEILPLFRLFSVIN
jgi:hypothetical protein